MRPIGILLGLIVFLLLPACTFGQGPDLLVLVRPMGDGAGEVTFVFPGVIGHNQARQYLRDLLTRTGWKGERVRVSDKSASDQGGRPMTGVSFRATPVLSGPLPVLAIIETFRAFPHQRLLFMMGPDYSFQGPLPYVDRYVAITGEVLGGVYSFEVRIKDASFEQLQPPTAAPAAAVRDSGPGVPWAALLFGSIAIGLVVYWVTDRYLLRRDRLTTRGG